MNSIWILIGVLTLLHEMSFGRAMSEPAPKYVHVSFTVKSPITLNEPVVADTLIENQVPYGITFDLGLSGVNAFHIRIIAPDGKDISVRSRVDDIRFAPMYIEPNDKFQKQLILNKWYSFDMPGNYQILITLEIPIIEGKTDLHLIKPQNESGHQT